jgi:hypothetical protein
MTIRRTVDYYQHMHRITCSASMSQMTRSLAVAATAAAHPRLRLALIPPRGA